MLIRDISIATIGIVEAKLKLVAIPQCGNANCLDTFILAFRFHSPGTQI